MAAANYPACLRAVLRYEGGKVDDPRDPGGRTNQGVTQRVYDAWRRSRALFPQDVYAMTDAERDAIYRKRYWDAVDGDNLPAGLDLVVFDTAVNSGVERALAWYAGPRSSIDAYCDVRLAYLRRLTTWKTYGKGWTTRVESVRGRAKMMAAAK